MFEGKFELFDVKVRRLQNGDKLSIALEASQDLDLEKQLIEFRGCTVKVFIAQAQEESKKAKKPFEGFFDVFDVKFRHLKNGSKLRLTLEELYDKKDEIMLVPLRFDVVDVSMEKQQPELPEMKQEESSDLD
jgi:hypothetical protein